LTDAFFIKFYGITQPGVFSWQLVAFNAVNALVPAVGLVLNALLVLVTVGDKSVLYMIRNKIRKNSENLKKLNSEIP
jgi:hypothetical protein